MNGYLGEKLIPIEDTPFKDYDIKDWMMYFIERYGQIDGDHHKLWVLDQVARISKETPIIIKQASWDNGLREWRVCLGEPSKQYLEWVKEMRGENGEQYSYDEGIAP
jgi:hypothetical protein